MSINSSSTLNASHQLNGYITNCFNSLPGFIIFCAFAITNFLLLLPLATFVLHVALQRWRRRRHSPMRRATSHTDVFTYHMVVMEVFTVLGSGLYCVAEWIKHEGVMMSALYLFSFVQPGQTSFHCLTCIERYLAVVYPITYLGLRKASGIRIRNISICCIWLMGCGWMAVTYVHLRFGLNVPIIPFFSFFSISLLVISFCSLSVLCALRRSLPGENGGDRERVDQSKQRTFHTIMAIMGVLLFRFSGMLVCLALHKYLITTGGDSRLVLQLSFWFNLPSSLVLPLLFLQRAEKLSCCKK